MKPEMEAVLEAHDLRRWARNIGWSGEFVSLTCPCGFITKEDSNEAMFRHVADMLPAASPAGPTVSVEHLAMIIRRVDGNHTLGAGELAEHILDELELPRPAGPQVREAQREALLSFRSWTSRDSDTPITRLPVSIKEELDRRIAALAASSGAELVQVEIAPGIYRYDAPVPGGASAGARVTELTVAQWRTAINNDFISPYITQQEADSLNAALAILGIRMRKAGHD